ncbi:MAG: hypothetical protein MUC96_17885 [Myxococcaceae bacterium]|nr:hypothetical protein [Myxococcaceae bacterium]
MRAVLVTTTFLVACGSPMGPVDAGSSGGGAAGGSVGGGQPATCSASTCDGCCTADGLCVTAAQVTNERCGEAGVLCQRCSGQQQCVAGACVNATGGGSAGGTAGGAGGGDAGGTAGGSAGGTAGGSAGGAAGGSAGGTAGGSAGGTAGGSAGGAAGGSAGGAADAGTGGGTPNQPPFLNGIVFTRPGGTTPLTSAVVAGQLVQFSADAFDAEGDPLTFTWSVDGGTLTNPTMTQPTWYSPEVTQLSSSSTPFPTFPVRVEVSDGVNPPVVTTQDISVRGLFLQDLVNESALGSSIGMGCRSCHSSNAHVSGLNLSLTGNQLRTALLADHTRGASCTSSLAGSTKRVIPFQPNRSLLMRKLEAPVPAACGSLMPQNRGALPANQVLMFRAWINAGAL